MNKKNAAVIVFLLGMLIISGSCRKQKNEAVNWLWIDASANFERLASEDSIRYYMDKIKKTGFDGVIVDLKPISGEVLYDSKIAPRALEWRGFTRDKDFDYPGLMIKYARENGLVVLAAMNCFSEGWKDHRRGTIYTTHPEWQTMLYLPEGIIPTTEYHVGYSAFVNPAIPEVREYQYALLEEILTRFDFDGIVLDRGRYDNIRSDFSDYSRQLFEAWLDEPVNMWPDDIFTWSVNNEGKAVHIPGKLFKEWIMWRATIIHDFFTEARIRVKSIRPDAIFSDYVGAWYPSYYELGVNWGSKDYDPSQEYDWALPEYKETGYAETLDFLFTGCYFYPVTIAEVESLLDNWKKKPNREAGMEEKYKPYHSVEGSAKMSMLVTKGKIPVYGSLYVQQYKDENDPEQFVKAMKILHQETDGMMIFDMVHLVMFDWWEESSQNSSR